MKKFFALVLLIALTAGMCFAYTTTNAYDRYGRKTGSYRQTYSGYNTYDKYGHKTGSVRKTYSGYNTYDKYGKKTGSYRVNSYGTTPKYDKYDDDFDVYEEY